MRADRRRLPDAVLAVFERHNDLVVAVDQSIVQYVGRILRPTTGKTGVAVHDYVDAQVPVLARMYDERAKGYASLGFRPPKRPRALGGSVG